MTWETFEAALSVISYFCRQGTQTELSLTGIGESLLHPQFLRMVEECRKTIGPRRPLVVTTNGLLLDDAMCAALAPFKPHVFVSLHRPELAAFAVEAAKKYGILAGINNSFATSSFDWAGYQKNWTPIRSAPNIYCDYLKLGWGVILVDGRIATCCLDADGSSTIGTIWDKPETLKLKPWGTKEKGCSACHMRVPE